MSGPATQKVTRRIIAKLASTNWFRNRRFRSEDFGHLLALAAGAANNDDITIDPVSLAASAFAVGSGDYEHYLSYELNNFEKGYDDGKDDDCILHVQRIKRTDGDRKRITTIGCFDSEDKARSANVDTLELGLSKDDVDTLVADLVDQSKKKKKASDDKDKLNAALEKVKQLQNENSMLKEEITQLKKRPSSASAEKRGHPKRTKDDDPMDVDEDEENSTIKLFYIFKGRAGEVQIGLDNDATITTAALKANIITEHLTSDELVHEGRATTYEVQRINKVDVLVPSGVSAVMNTHLSMWQNKAKKIDKFIKLFSKDKCVIPPEIMRIFTSFSMHNSGGSDQATTELFYASIKMINAYLELGLTNEQIGKGCFCQTTLANSEFELAAHSTLSVAEELKDIKYIAVSQDGGNKKGDEYLAIVITYPVVNKDGSLGFQRTCLDCVPCGKKKDEIVEAIAISLRRLYRYTDARCIAITGDSGGGGAVQTIFSSLQTKLEHLLRYIRCILHALHKGWERGIIASTGPTGINNNSPTQLAYASINFLIVLKEECGTEQYREYFRLVKQMLVSNGNWQEEADRVLPQFHSKWLDFLDSDDYGAIALAMEDALTGIQRAVSSRWQTLIPGIKLVVEHPLEIYFLAKVIASDKSRKRSSYLVTCACDVIALMNIRATPIPTLSEDVNNNDNNTNQAATTSTTTDVDMSVSEESTPEPELSLMTCTQCPNRWHGRVGTSGTLCGACEGTEVFTNSSSTTSTSNYYDKKLKPGQSSTLMTALTFLYGFSHMYSNFFTLACRPDKRFGSNSYAQIAGDCVVRCYLMRKAVLDMMKEGGLENLPAFDMYRKALEGIPYMNGDVTKGGREFFAKMEKVFFEEFLASYKDHVEHWRSDMLLPYILAGNKELAKEFIKWLMYYDEQGDDAEEYTWPDETVELAGHDTTGKTTKVNIAECMGYLTANAKPKEILEDVLITSQKGQLLMYGASDDHVDLLDKSTWSSPDEFKDLQTLIHTMVLIHPAHNQGVESYIHAVGTITKTGVGPKRASARMVVHSRLVRRHNIESLTAKRERQTDEAKKDMVQRTKDKERNVTFANTLDDLLANIKKMRGKTEESQNEYDNKIKELIAEYNTTEGKAIESLKKKKLMNFEKAANTELVTYAAMEKKDGAYVPPAIGQKIIAFFLRAKETGHKEAVHAEITARGITVDPVLFANMGWRAKIALLKTHELGELGKKSMATINGKPMTVGDVKNIEPYSDELKALLPQQNEWDAKRRTK